MIERLYKMSRYRKRLFAWKAAWAVPLLCGCAIPQLEPPVEPYLRQIQSVDLPVVTQTTDVADPNSEDGPLTLERCQRIALARNPLEEAARMGVAAARAAVGQARSAYYPTFDATASYSRWQRHIFLPEGLVRPGISPIVGPTDDWRGSLDAGYILYDSGKRRAELLTALAEQEVETWRWHEIREDLVLNVHTAFYSYLAALDAETVAEQNLMRARNHLDMAQQRYEAGAIPYAEVLRIKVDVSEARLARVRAESSVAIAHSRLNTAMGLPAGMPLEVSADDEPVTAPEQEMLAVGLEQAMHLRADVQAALYGIAAARSDIAAARSAYGPRISARGQYGREDDQFFPDDDNWSAGVFLELPLFDGHARDSRVKRSRAQLARQEAQTRNLLLRVRQEVWESHSQVEEAYEAVQATETVVEEAGESMRLTEERYQVGEATTNDLLDARTALVRAEGNRAQTHWSYQIAMANFHRSVGTLLPRGQGDSIDAECDHAR